MRDIVTHTLAKIKGFVGGFREEVGVSLVIILVSTSSYYLGRLSLSLEVTHPAITIEDSTLTSGVDSGEARLVSKALDSDGQVVATKNGKKWYMPWCPTVARLAESAKRHFASVAAAEAAGLTKAQNCAGMK